MEFCISVGTLLYTIFSFLAKVLVRLLFTYVDVKRTLPHIIVPTFLNICLQVGLFVLR